MTTLHELEVLIRRIEEALAHPVLETAVSRLAAEYNASARAASTRLNQCAAMLAAGDEHQALQLAETQPALLDQLTLLAFRRSPQWRALLRAENLPTAETFDIKAVRQLNELYTKGIDKDHALYRDYRRAVMLNDDARALSILRSIVRLNANDKNAKAEFDRLEQKIRADKIRQLEKLTDDDTTNPAAIVALADELERTGPPPNVPAWFDAQSIRAEYLLRRAEAAKKSGSWEEFERAFEKLRLLTSFLRSVSRMAFEELEQWAASEKARRKEAASLKAAVEQLAIVIAKFEQEHFATRKSSLDELRQNAETLERAWQRVAHFRIPIAPTLASSAEKLRDQFQNQIESSQRSSRRLAFAAVAAVVLLCLGGAYFAYQQQSAYALIKRVHTLVEARQISETERAVAELQKYSMGRGAAELATGVIAKERALKDYFDGKRAALEGAAQGGFTNATPEKINSDFADARHGKEQLAPEFRPAADAALGRVEREWQQFLDRTRAIRTARFQAILDPIEAAANRDLRYNGDPETVAGAANSLLKQLEPARLIARAFLDELRPKQEALFRLENLESRIGKFGSDATNFVSARTALAGVGDLAGFNSALQLLVSSGFTPTPERTAAAAVAGLNLTPQGLLGPLVLPNAPAAVLAAPHLPRYPDEVLPAEREIQRRLRDDENIHGVSRLQIEVKALPANDARRKRTVFLRGELQRRITRRAGQVYDPVESPGALQFAQKEFGSLEFNVEEPTATPEKELYDRAGLGRLLDSNTGKYQASLLQVLDDVNQDRLASVVFRAWLFTQVSEMIDLQPAQWGAVWSPSFNKDRDELMRLGAKQIHSGDWLVPAVNSQRAAGLLAHFDRAALHSYAREAAFFKRLLPKAMESGVTVVGYVGADGEPVLKAGHAALWGLAAGDQKPALLFEHVSPNERPQARVAPLPFTPLFVFGGNASELIEATLQSSGYAANAVGLPNTLPPILRPTP